MVVAVTITGSGDEHIRDVIGAALVGGPNVTITPDDPANTITISAIGGGSSVGQIRITGTAFFTMSGHRLVTERSDGKLEYATNTNPAHVHGPIWLTTASATTGASVDVLTYGVFTEPTWAWTVGPLYLGATGLITQTPPTAPGALFLIQVGTATTPTSIILDVGSPIVLI